MTIYLSRSFRRCNSSLLLSSGNALKSEVLRLREGNFLMDVGVGSPRICMQDALTRVPINPTTTRFENKVGYLDLVPAGESPIKKHVLERFFIDLVAGEALTKERAAARFKKLVGSTDVVPGEPLLLLPRRFRQNRAWIKLNKIWPTNANVKGLICRKIKGGYSVAIAGFLTFLPSKALSAVNQSGAARQGKIKHNLLAANMNKLVSKNIALNSYGSKIMRRTFCSGVPSNVSGTSSSDAINALSAINQSGAARQVKIKHNLLAPNMNRLVSKNIALNSYGSKIMRRAFCSGVPSNVSGTSSSDAINDRRAKDEHESSSPQFDIAIIGGGMVGMGLACSLARMSLTKNLSVAIVDSIPALLDTTSIKKDDPPDPRVSTVTPTTISLFKGVGAWQYIEQHRHAYFDKMQVWDYTGLGFTRYNARDVYKEVLG